MIAPPTNPAPVCPTCGGLGWYYRDGANGAILTRCRCGSGANDERRRAYLERIDGLKAHEREISFKLMTIDPANQDAVMAVVGAATAGRGMITLHGDPGTGKTFLLMAAVNAARARGVPAVYTTVTDLLDHLRAAFDPRSEETFDRRWDLLLTCEVLALDELDEFNTTPWAMERFLRLIDERWRSMRSVLTLCATNDLFSAAIPDKVRSRIGDNRAAVFPLSGADRRGKAAA